ncbi:Auxin-responsive protein IAA31 [Bienertia sinuspersici]
MMTLYGTCRGQYSDWPPIKQLLRSTLVAGKSNCRRETLFVKVYMEGIPIGRKLDLLAHHGYHSLITTLVQMFRTTILCKSHLFPPTPFNELVVPPISFPTIHQKIVIFLLMRIKKETG